MCQVNDLAPGVLAALCNDVFTAHAETHGQLGTPKAAWINPHEEHYCITEADLAASDDDPTPQFPGYVAYKRAWAQWCERFNMPDWVIESVVSTFDHFRRNPQVPPTPADILAMWPRRSNANLGPGDMPVFEVPNFTWRKSIVPRKLFQAFVIAEVTKRLADFNEDAATEPPTSRKRPTPDQHYEWLVRHVVLRESFESIGGGDPRTVRRVVNALRKQVVI